MPSSVFTPSWVDDPGLNGVGARQTLKNMSFRGLGHHLGTTNHSLNSVDRQEGGVNVPKGILAEPSASVDSDLGTLWHDNTPVVETESVCLRLSTPLVNTTPVGTSGSPFPDNTITAVQGKLTPRFWDMCTSFSKAEGVPGIRRFSPSLNERRSSLRRTHTTARKLYRAVHEQPFRPACPVAQPAHTEVPRLPNYYAMQVPLLLTLVTSSHAVWTLRSVLWCIKGWIVVGPNVSAIVQYSRS